ncbi:PHP domain-containing protein [Halobacterium salinarum]|nr:PHP domain-containing protein [Halobacterium salinarum]
MVHADLHVHTTNSDGTLTIDAVPDAAHDAGVTAVAITDHYRLHPALDAPVTVRDDITVIHGIELRVDTGPQRVDLLGYGVHGTDALTAECDRIQRDRRDRGRRIIDRVEARLGVSLPLEPRPGLGRPHIARAITAHPDTDYDTMDAVFDSLIGNDGPCFVARDVPDFETGVDLLTDACGLVGLAHPLRYDDPQHALALCAALDAVEAHYPYDRPVGTAPDDGAALVADAIDTHDLIPTGGTDAHDHTLGTAGLDRDAYAAVRTRLAD